MIRLVEISSKTSVFSYYITESAKKLDDSSISNKTLVDKKRIGGAICKQISFHSSDWTYSSK
jgi:hypothetical protein